MRPMMPSATRLPLRFTAGNRKRDPSPSNQDKGERRKSPKNGATNTAGGKGKEVDSVVSQAISSNENEENEQPETVIRADSPFDVVYSSAHEDLALLRNTAHELRDILQEFREIAGLQTKHIEHSQPANRSRNPPKNWREAPEQLNEAEKDALQSAIQEAHRKDLEEMERQRVEKEREEEFLGDDILTDCGGDASEGDDGFSDA